MNKQQTIWKAASALVIATALVACTTTGRKGTVSGKLSNAAGKMIYLQRAVNNMLMTTDSTMIGSDGSFSIVPEQPLGMDFYKVSIDPKNAITIITDSTEALVLEGDFTDLQGTTKASGSPATEALRELELQCAPLNKNDQQTVNRLSDPSVSKEEKAQLRQNLADSRKQRTDFMKTWLDNNSSSLGALLVVSQLDVRVDSKYYTKVFTDLKAGHGDMPMYKAIKQEVDMTLNPPPRMDPAQANAATAPGQPAPEIEMKDRSGKTRKLSDLRGKTVLIDFWASWCGPCRGENPNVLKAYSKYNKDGFEVFSVSLDRDKTKWEEAIAKDGLVWPGHVSELKHWDCTAARSYGVSSIPKTFLVDKDGKIIASDLRGPALDAKLQAIYGR
ncbi:MAG: redoxin domain-containing protein [Flavobacteriales bacterium]